MLSFFPTPYKDELLYSVLARYHIRSGNQSPKKTVRELFGKSTNTAVVDLPSNIGALVSNLPLLNVLDNKQLIEQHTLFPFYKPFLFKTQANLVEKSMTTDNGQSIHVRAGIVASTIKLQSFIYICSKCFEESQSLYGEAYWNRIHQIPGVFVCPYHKEFLINGKNLINANKHEFLPAVLEDVDVNLNSLSINDNVIEELYHISRDVNFLLNTENAIPSPEILQLVYVHLLKQKGFALSSGRVKQKQLQEQFIKCYGLELLNLYNSNVTLSEYNWLSNIVRKPRKSFHPIRHILLMRFLLSSVEEFLKYLKSLGVSDNNPIKNIISTSVNLETNKVLQRSVPNFKVEEKRKKWLELKIEFPKYTKDELRNMEPSVFMWLYRNDKEWLKNNSPTLRTNNIQNRNRVNWIQRDLEFKKELVDVIDNWNDEIKPERRTKRSILIKTSRPHYLEKYPKKLPICIHYINSVTESIEEFHLRKILHAIKCFSAQSRELKEWKIIKAAGINEKYHQRAKGYFAYLLQHTQNNEKGI